MDIESFTQRMRETKKLARKARRFCRKAHQGQAAAHGHMAGLGWIILALLLAAAVVRMGRHA